MRSNEDLVSWMAKQQGIAHSSVLVAEGFTVHGLRVAVAEGVLERVRRGWFATPGCDSVLRRAVAVGGRLTCLSAAKRRGLWTPDHESFHVAVPPTASRIDAAGLRLHWSRGPVPVAAKSVEDPIVNVLFHAARCAPPADALAVWESAIRKNKVSASVLERIDWRSERARGFASIASFLSDSGLETRFLLLMRSLGVKVRQQVRIDGHRVDALIGDRLVVQIDGFAHHTAAARRRDLRQDARLALRGYTVLRFDYHQLLFQPDHVTAMVAHAIAQRLHAVR